MEPARFDSLTRSAANRRDLLTRLGLGGLAAALAANLGVRRASAQTVSCSLDLRASVRLGPSAGIPLMPSATQAGSVAGTLQLGIAGDGSLETAEFLLTDGTSLPVTGQAIGHQLAVRVALDDLRSLVLQGVAQQPLRICEGSIDGSLIGPTDGDLGDFHAMAISGGGESASSGIAAPAATSATTDSVATSTPTTIANPTPSPTAECLPLGNLELCGDRNCGPRDDGCGGIVDCGGCLPGEKCGSFQVCCTPLTAAEYCTPEQCGLWAEPCGDLVDCGGCDAGYECPAGACCGATGTGCFVGSECCSGSCSMLNGCN